MTSILIFLTTLRMLLILVQSHPIAFSLFLLSLSLLVRLQLITYSTVWMGLGLALIFIGGIIIIILYVRALVTESKFFISNPTRIVRILILLFISPSITNRLFHQVQLPLFSFYLPLSAFTLIFLTFYLLLTLIIAVIIREIHNGPIAQWR